MNIKIRFIVLLLFFPLMLTFALAGVEAHKPEKASVAPRVLSAGVAKELEELGGMKIASIVLMDSKTGKTKHFKHDETQIRPDGTLQLASTIEKITSISVVRVRGVARDDIYEDYEFCDYISIDGQTELICKKTDSKKSDHVQDIPNIPPKLVAQLEKKSDEINDLSFLTLVDLESGQTKLFKHEDYEQVTAAFPQSIFEIGKTTSMTFTNFKQNPCCVMVVIDGRVEVHCRKKC